MFRLKLIAIILLLTIIASCQSNNVKKIVQEKNKISDTELRRMEVLTKNPVVVPLENGLAKAYFASGCFWCVEAIYESVIGVKEVINGYSGGYTDDPTYENSNTGRTGHAEAIEVIYDPKKVSFSTLVDVYFGSQNPKQFNGQGGDRGSQYRSIIFYQNDEQKEIIKVKKRALVEKLQSRVAAEIYPFIKFWVAEDYHQNYERLHPNNSYIRNVSVPRLKRFQKKFPELIKEKH